MVGLGAIATLLFPLGKMALTRAFGIVDKTISDGTQREQMKTDIVMKRLDRSADVLGRLGVWIWAAFAFPLALYFNKIVIYDKMLGWGTTDPLTGLAGEWAGIIIGAVFLVPVAGGAVNSFTNRRREKS
jgi:hypothetical protein